MTPILLLVVVSLLMVVAMVRFSAAIVERADSSAAVGWGVVYAGSWAAILSAASRVARDANDEPSTALLTLIVAAWGTFHAFWIWLVLGAASPARDTVRNTAGRLCLAGLAVLAFAAWQLVSAGLSSPARPGHGLGPLGWMILVAIAGVALFVAGAIRVAARDARLPEHEIEGRPNYAMVAGTALMLIGALGAAIAALLNY